MLLNCTTRPGDVNRLSADAGVLLKNGGSGGYNSGVFTQHQQQQLQQKQQQHQQQQQQQHQQQLHQQHQQQQQHLQHQQIQKQHQLQSTPALQSLTPRDNNAQVIYIFIILHNEWLYLICYFIIKEKTALKKKYVKG